MLWFTTTGWMMWNTLVSGLLVGATPVLVDGNPGHPDLGALWRIAAEAEVDALCVGAAFLMDCRRAEVVPPPLPRLGLVAATGAPLPAEGFRWVHEAVGASVRLASTSGGTDVCSAFVGGVELVPVRAGEISCRMLACAVAAFDPAGNECPPGVEGELVVTAPMPSMPLGFWGDADGARLRATYFDTYPGIWRHGDWITFTDDGACVISGRSDATLNRGGVRLGTGDLYAVVDQFPEIVDSLVVHLEAGAERPRGTLALFVVLAPGGVLDDDLVSRVRSRLRRDLSPRHVPDTIESVPAIPRTVSGKKLEVPVKRILLGSPPDDVASRGSLADPGALDWFVARSRARRG
jgi:acetoacetyl-CoA synthetase